jgi:hypothetical protein
VKEELPRNKDRGMVGRYPGEEILGGKEKGKRWEDIKLRKIRKKEVKGWMEETEVG